MDMDMEIAMRMGVENDHEITPLVSRTPADWFGNKHVEQKHSSLKIVKYINQHSKS